MVKVKTDKALKAFYGARDSENPNRVQEVFTPVSLVQPLLNVWGEIELDPCGHRDSPVSQVAKEVWYGEVTQCNSKGVAVAWDGAGLAFQWQEKTYCNPPFSQLSQWLRHSARHPDHMDQAVLMPARLQRKWLRAYLNGRTVVALNSVKFHGYDQAFPQALLMVISGDCQEAVGRAYEDLGLGEVLC